MVGQFFQKRPNFKKIRQAFYFFTKVLHTVEPAESKQIFVDGEVSRKRNVRRRKVKLAQDVFAGRSILLSQDSDTAAGWRNKVKKHLNRGRLSRAVRAQKPGDGAFLHVK